jgi:hypothetical protein
MEVCYLKVARARGPLSSVTFEQPSGSEMTQVLSVMNLAGRPIVFAVEVTALYERATWDDP